LLFYIFLFIEKAFSVAKKKDLYVLDTEYLIGSYFSLFYLFIDFFNPLHVGLPKCPGCLFSWLFDPQFKLSPNFEKASVLCFWCFDFFGGVPHPSLPYLVVSCA